MDFFGGTHEFGYMHLPTQYHTPDAVKKAIKQGKIAKMETVGEFYNRIKGNVKSPCVYTPTIQADRTAVSTCFNRHEYPIRAITLENFEQVLLAPFSNPRSKHLFSGATEEREKAFVKQFGFAMALKPSLEAEKKTLPPQELEARIFPNSELMINVEMLYLLDDILRTAMNNDVKYMQFNLKKVPIKLIDELVSDKKLLEAYLTYYSLHADKDDYLLLPVDKSRALFRCKTMQTKIKFLQDYLETDIVKNLQHRGVELFDLSENIPENYTRVSYEGDKPLPSIEKEIGSIQDALEKWLSSKKPMDRKKGFNLIGTMIKDAMDLNEVKEILLAHFTAGSLNEDERIRAVGLLQEWIDKVRAEKKQYNISFIAEVLNNLNNDFEQLDVPAKTILTNL